MRLIKMSAWVLLATSASFATEVTMAADGSATFDATCSACHGSSAKAPRVSRRL